MRLTNREMELFKRICQMGKELSDAYPEVGMGKFPIMIAEEQASRISFGIDQEDIEEASESIKYYR
jgi:tRNA/tmRNA/rRNA uracil-C5-methylase (TrmA/RlmC/RlmD family)